MNQNKNTEEAYCLTVKGALAAEFGDTEGELIWNSLLRFAKKCMEFDGETGVPCIVLCDGGEVFGVEKVEEKA